MRKTREVLAFILNRAGKNGVLTTTLVKTVYLADCECRRYFGKQISEFVYFFHKNGPYDYDFKVIIDYMVDKDEIGFKSVSRNGRVYFTKKDPELQRLSANEIYILKNVCQKIEKKDLEEILKDAYITEPMQGVKKGDILDMDKLNNTKSRFFKGGISLEAIAQSDYEISQGKTMTLEEVFGDLSN